MNSLTDELTRRSRRYQASRVLYESSRADLREAVVDALEAGYQVTDLVDLVSFSRQTIYDIAKSTPAKSGAEEK